MRSQHTLTLAVVFALCTLACETPPTVETIVDLRADTAELPSDTNPCGDLTADPNNCGACDLTCAPNIPCRLGLAEVYVKLGQKQNAIDFLERAKATRPGDTRISAIEATLPK